MRRRLSRKRRGSRYANSAGPQAGSARRPRLRSAVPPKLCLTSSLGRSRPQRPTTVQRRRAPEWLEAQPHAILEQLTKDVTNDRRESSIPYRVDLQEGG